MRRVESIQFLRFVAALMVVIYHAVTHVGRGSGGDVPVWLYKIAGIGAAGVPVFFVISGFVMYYTSHARFAAPRAPQAFILRRAIRIYPIFWISLCVYLTAGFATGQGYEHGPLKTLAILLLLPGSAATIIPPGWTLAYEMYFYVVFAGLLVFSRHVALGVLAAFFVLSVAVGTLTDIGKSNAFFSLATNVLLLEFLAGTMLAAMLVEGWLPHWTGSRAFLWVMFAASAAGFAASPILDAYGLPGVMTLGVPSLLLVAGCVLSEHAGHLGDWVKRWSWLGDCSYALYLIHMIVVTLLVPLVAPHASGLASLLGAAGLITAASLVSGFALHIFAERPVLHFLHTQLLVRPTRSGT